MQFLRLSINSDTSGHVTKKQIRVYVVPPVDQLFRRGVEATGSVPRGGSFFLRW